MNAVEALDDRVRGVVELLRALDAEAVELEETIAAAMAADPPNEEHATLAQKGRDELARKRERLEAQRAAVEQGRKAAERADAQVEVGRLLPQMAEQSRELDAAADRFTAALDALAAAGPELLRAAARRGLAQREVEALERRFRFEIDWPACASAKRIARANAGSGGLVGRISDVSAEAIDQVCRAAAFVSDSRNVGEEWAK